MVRRRARRDARLIRSVREDSLPRTRFATRITLAGLTLVGFWLRVDGLAGQALWSDEDITLDRARLPLLEMLRSLPVEHAPLYFMSMRPWTLLVGESDFVLRFPSALDGTIAIALAGYVGVRLFGRVAGVTAALLVATQLFAISYGQEARMYALLLAISLAAPAAVLHAESLERRGAQAWRWWIGAGVLTGLAALTHYYGALVAFVLAAWAMHDLFWATRRPGHERTPVIKSWLMLFGTAGLLFLPWLPRALAIGDFPGWREATASAALRSIFGAWLGATSIGSDPVSGASSSAIGALEPGVAPLQFTLIALPLTLAAIGTAWALFTLVWGWRFNNGSGTQRSGPALYNSEAEWRGAARLLAWLGVPAAVVGVLLWRSPDIHPRYLMALHSAIWLASGAGAAVVIRTLPRWTRPVATIALLAAVALSSASPLANYRSGEERQKQSYRALLTEVDRHADGRDTVLLLDGPPFGLTQRYSAPDSPVKIENLHSTTNLARDPEGFEDRLEELVERRPHVWLATDGAAKNLAGDWLARHLYPVSTAGYQDITLSRFFAPQPPELEVPAPFEASDPRGPRCVSADGSAVEVGAFDLPAPEASLIPPLALPDYAALCLRTITNVELTVWPGDVVPIWLWWMPGPAWPESPPAAREHRVSVRLVNAEGAVVSSADRRPAAWTRPSTGWTPGESVTDRHGLLVPAAEPYGPHEIVIVFYDESTLTPFGAWSLPLPVQVVEDAGAGAGAGDAEESSDSDVDGGAAEDGG